MAPSSFKTSLKQLCVKLHLAKTSGQRINKLNIASPAIIHGSERISEAAVAIADQQLFLIQLYNPTLAPHTPTFPLVTRKTQVAAEQSAASSLSRQDRVKVVKRQQQSNKSLRSADETDSAQQQEKERPTTPSEDLFTASAPPSPTSSKSSFTPSPIFDSPSRFTSSTVTSSSPVLTQLDSASASASNNDDKFTALPPRVFPIRRTTQSNATNNLIPTTTTTLSALFSGPSPSCSVSSLASLADLGEGFSLEQEVSSGLVHRGEVFSGEGELHGRFHLANPEGCFSVVEEWSE